MLQDSKDAWKNALVDGVYNGSAALSTALATGKLGSLGLNSENVAMNILEPATVSNLVKVKQGYTPDYTDASAFDKMIDNFRYRAGLESKFPKAVDVFGEKKGATPVGTNPFVYYNVLPVQQSEDDAIKLLPVVSYMKDRNIKITPDYQNRQVKKFDGKMIKLNPDQYSDLKTFVGNSRLNQLRQIPDWNSYSDRTREQYIINIMHSGKIQGINLFNLKYPTLRLSTPENATDDENN